MEEQSIRSPHNPRVKNLVRLRDGGHRRRQGLFIIEGRRELSRALEKGIALSEIYYAPEYFPSTEYQEVVTTAQAGGAEVCHLSKEAFAKCSYRQGPDGLLAVVPQWKHTFEDIRLSNQPLVLVLESVEKPGNLGALLRSADAAGVDAVILTDPVTDIFNPNVIRASQGAVFSQTVVVSDNEAARNWLSCQNIHCFATTPKAEQDYWQADLTQPAALVLGSEKDGLSKFWLDPESTADRLKIPLQGRSDSLNVSAAAAVILFEALRQRSAS